MQKESDLLRFTTAGSVDDGKSTLIGRLLYDTRSIYEDQLEAMERATLRRGEQGMNLALLTDGLRAERDQGITIDVAYRYFSTPRRKFIIADTPGHVQYTRNMITGASTADLAIVLVDARRGVQTQSRRHGYIAALLRMRSIVVAVNKMDLVHFDQAPFDAISREYRAFAADLGVTDISFVPISALLGDNIVDRSSAMPWYAGRTLLEALEAAPAAERGELLHFRFPVQHVVRPNQDFRGVAGRISSGAVSVGDRIAVLPSRQTARIAAIVSPHGDVSSAGAGDSVVIRVDHELDVGRGDMITHASHPPHTATQFQATLCWMHEESLQVGAAYVLQHTTRQLQAFVTSVEHSVNVDTLAQFPASTLVMNDIGKVTLRTTAPLFFDSYEQNRETGSFILIDAGSNVTVAAGMILTALPEAVIDNDRTIVSPGAVWSAWNIPRDEREVFNRHPAVVVWFTGPPSAGKSTIAQALERRLHDIELQTALLDGDQLRHGLCGDLGFSDDDRRENIRRAGEVARLFFEHGHIVLCSFVSPHSAERQRVRSLFPARRFVEVHIHADAEILAARDPKGLYARARAGVLADLTGVSAEYEAPLNPELRFDTGVMTAEQIVDRLTEYLMEEVF